MNLLWSRIYDVILKTILAGEHHVMQAMKKNGMHRTNCFEILGFDVLIDSDLKPWLLEVNLSPSLATDSPLDHTIKSTLLADAFNLVGVRRFDRKKESLNKIKHRMKGYYGSKGPGGGGGGGPRRTGGGGLTSGIQGTGLSSQGTMGGGDMMSQAASAHLLQMVERYITENPQDYMTPIHEGMRKAVALRHREFVRETCSEYQKRGNFIRIYPAKNSDIYDQYFAAPRPFNRIIYKALFTDEIIRCST